MGKRRIIILIAFFCVIALFLASLIWMFGAKQFCNAKKLIEAIEASDVEQVQLLLDAGVDPNQTDIPVSRYWSLFEFTARRPLSIACGTGNFEIVNLLITYGATAEEKEYTGWSPLKMTLFHTHKDDLKIVKLLLSNGAQPNRNEPDSLLVFDAANLYPMLLGDEHYTTGYDADVAKDITVIVDLLLEETNIDVQAGNGDTLLICAARRGNMELVQHLIGRGCSLSTRNNQGKTAFDVAIEHNKLDIAALLKQYQ